MDIIVDWTQYVTGSVNSNELNRKYPHQSMQKKYTGLEGTEQSRKKDKCVKHIQKFQHTYNWSARKKIEE